MNQGVLLQTHTKRIQHKHKHTTSLTRLHDNINKKRHFKKTKISSKIARQKFSLNTTKRNPNFLLNPNFSEIVRKTRRRRRTMFYSQTFLARKGPLSTVWIAAHLQHRLKKSQYASTDIPSTVRKYPFLQKLIFFVFYS